MRNQKSGKRELGAMRDSRDSVKFMQVLDRTIFQKLSRSARSRGVTVQELIRAIVIPFWMVKFEEESTANFSRRRRLSRARRDGRRPITLGVSTGRGRR
jgi:hypothetical protein